MNALVSPEYQGDLQITRYPETSLDEGKGEDQRRNKEEWSTRSLVRTAIVYVRETGRALEMRFKEHKYAVKTGDTKNGIAVHAWTNKH